MCAAASGRIADLATLFSVSQICRYQGCCCTDRGRLPHLPDLLEYAGFIFFIFWHLTTPFSMISLLGCSHDKKGYIAEYGQADRPAH